MTSMSASNQKVVGASRLSFEKDIFSSVHDLTLGNFEAAHSGVERASKAAETPEQRAAVAVVDIQVLQELGRTEEALARVRFAASDQNVSLTHDLVLVAASLGMHTENLEMADRVLAQWLERRCSNSQRGASQLCQRDSEVVELYALEVAPELHGYSRSAAIVEQAAVLLEEAEYRKLRDSISNRKRHCSLVAAGVGSGASASSRALEVAEGAPRFGHVAVVGKMRMNIRSWLLKRGFSERIAVVWLAVTVACLWAYGRPRERHRHIFTVLRQSVVETLRVAFGPRAGKWTN